MEISRFRNNYFFQWLTSDHGQADSSQLLEHIKEINLSNRRVINPMAKEFQGEVLAFVVYRELLKINKPVEFVLIVGAVLSNAMAGIQSEYSQDQLMQLKQNIAKHAICLLCQEEREHTATILSSDILYDVFAKLLWCIDNEPHGFKTFYLTEMISILSLFHKYLHGQEIVDSNHTISLVTDEQAVLETGYSQYISQVLP